MKVTPAAAPSVTANTNAPTPASQDARARAIAKLSNPIPTDANNVSVEEIGSVMQSRPSREPGETKLKPEPTIKVEPTETEKKEESPLSSQYAILARKEKALRAQAQKQQQELKAERERIASERQSWQEEKQKYETEYIPKSKLKERTLESLAEAGVTYEEVTQRQIEAGEVSPTVKAYLERLEARIAKQDDELTSFRKAGEEQQGEAYKAAIRQIRQDASALVKDNPDYETIRATNSTRDVVELIELTWKEEQRVMSVEEAAGLVEDHLLEEIDRLTNLEKVKKRKQTQNASGEAPQTQPPNSNKQPQPMKTLTNAAASTRKLSAKERAILAFKGELE